MDLKRISKFLIFFGIALVVIAFTMDTSVSSGYRRVYNMGLISQQQNLLIIGGIAFLAGIILFSANHKPHSSSLNESDSSLYGEGDLNQDFKRISSILLGYLKKWVFAKRDNKLGRSLIFLYTLPWVGLLGAMVKPDNPLSMLPFFVLTIFVLSPLSAVIVILSLLCIHIVSELIVIAVVFTTGNFPYLAILLIGLIITNFLIIRRLKQYQKNIPA